MHGTRRRRRGWAGDPSPSMAELQPAPHATHPCSAKPERSEVSTSAFVMVAVASIYAVGPVGVLEACAAAR